ncbi:hypothetical protein Q8A67_016914 [Cirrhinus molitorella]|uniref:Apolipo L3-like protein n=1 Tax=Cirrhinus molitorella TaxID=172907 RepID=A0AA88PIW8_9TELE|nr:hypothetical protein Q8A67_016914 [Cirrhinus molitorella]
MDIYGRGAQLEGRLTAYVEDTLNYIETVRDFCGQEQNWTSERRAELEKLRDINENQQEENLGAIIKDTLKGLEELEPFLDAVEKLTLTSCHVFSEEIFLLWGKSPEIVQLVITDAGTDAPVLILFKRNAETFFQPLLHNVNVLIFQLNNYILKTEQLCRRIRQRYSYNKIFWGSKIVLILNVSENGMNQMLHHLNQLCEIRKDQDTQLVFLFQENAQKFIDVFSECRSRMHQFLSDLEERAVKLDRMKMGASISTVAGSSVGILGGVLSIIGIFFAPFTAGVSLGVSLAGAGLGGLSAVNTLVTGVTEMAVNHHHERNAQNYLKSYKDDMTKIEDCLTEAANSERPLVQPSGVDVQTILHFTGEVIQETVDGAEAIALYKSEKVIKAATGTALEDLKTVRYIPQVAKYLPTIEALTKVPTLTITKFTRVASGIANVFFIGLDSYFIVKESISLAHGSETEVSKLIRSRSALLKSELEAWEEMYDSLCIGIKTIRKSQDTLEKPFLH